MTGSTESRDGEQGVAGAAGVAAGRRVPDFFIVGHPKSGTTALYEMLRRHPQIFMPDLKEPRWFASDLRARFQPDAQGGGRPPLVPQTYDEYLALFDPATPSQRVGEASPSYLRSRTAAGLIAEAQPDARIIAVLREPTSFLRSMHLELVQNHIETEKDFRAAMANEVIAPAAGEADPAGGAPILRYSDRVRYVEQLERFSAVFPPEQMLVLIYDDFRSDNEATVRRVLRFLGVDDSLPIAAVEANPTVQVRSLRLDRLVHSLYAGSGPVSRALKATIKLLTPPSWHGEGFQSLRRRMVYGAPPSVDEAYMRELRPRFEAEVRSLSRYLDRDLISEWGYTDAPADS
jgi:hypothetical protein